MKRHLPEVVGQYPLEIGLVAWGAVATLNAATGAVPSNALRVLPDALEMTWAALMGVSALTTAIGLVLNRFSIISSGMYLFATILMTYSIAVLSASDWRRGGVIAGFLGTIGLVCLIRGWWLRKQEVALIKEIARTERKDS